MISKSIEQNKLRLKIENLLIEYNYRDFLTIKAGFFHIGYYAFGIHSKIDKRRLFPLFFFHLYKNEHKQKKQHVIVTLLYLLLAFTSWVWHLYLFSRLALSKYNL